MIDRWGKGIVGAGAFKGSSVERNYISLLRRDLEGIVLNGQRAGLSLFD